MKTIGEILLFCAIHNLPLRGHNEQGAPEGGKGIFLDMIQYTAQRDPVYRSKLAQLPKNSTQKYKMKFLKF